MKLLVAALAVVIGVTAYSVNEANKAFQAYKPKASNAEQMVDLDLADNYLSEQQKEMLHLAISEGFTVKAVPVIENNDEHFVIILGEPIQKEVSRLDALDLVASQFSFAGVDGVQMSDLPVLSPDKKATLIGLVAKAKKLLGREGKFEHALKSDSAQVLVNRSEVVYNTGDKVDHKEGNGFKASYWLEAGDLSKFVSADVEISPRDLRMVSNVRKAFGQLSSQRMMLMVVDRGSVDRLSSLLQQGNPSDYVLKILRSNDEEEQNSSL